MTLTPESTPSTGERELGEGDRGEGERGEGGVSEETGTTLKSSWVLSADSTPSGCSLWSSPTHTSAPSNGGIKGLQV